MSNKKEPLIKFRFASKLFNSAKKIPTEFGDDNINIKTFNDLLAYHNLSDGSDESKLKIKKVYLFNLISYYIFFSAFIFLLFLSLSSSSIFNTISILLLAIISLVSSLPNLKLCWQINHKSIGRKFEFISSPVSFLPTPLKDK